MSEKFTLHLGDCIATMRAMPDASVDSIVTDPPYELGFMGRAWDASGIANSVEMWREALRVLKPGGHLLAFSGSRTYHRMVCAIEDAGFEIRDQIMWVYASGFPKSLDVSKAIDKAAGAERQITGRREDGRYSSPMAVSGRSAGIMGDVVERLAPAITVPATDAARQWQGWGTALKPAHEPIVVARKPLVGTVAANVLLHGTGAINVDACRVGSESTRRSVNIVGVQQFGGANHRPQHDSPDVARENGSDAGRWPANLIHDGSEEVLDAFPSVKSGAVAEHHQRHTVGGNGNTHGAMAGARGPLREASTGSAARFFYCAKADRADRNEGVFSGILPATAAGATMSEREGADWQARNGNHHPTVKPTDLMAYLCRLVTPPGGVVLDPFMGSGSTGKAAVLEGFRFVGIDMTPEYVEIARARIDFAARQGHQPGLI